MACVWSLAGVIAGVSHGAARGAHGRRRQQCLRRGARAALAAADDEAAARRCARQLAWRAGHSAGLGQRHGVRRQLLQRL